MLSTHSRRLTRRLRPPRRKVRTLREPAGDAAATDEPDTDGPATIGGAETGLTLEIPDEWVDIPMGTEAMSEDLGALDIADDRATFIESSISELGNVDGVVMAVDSSTFGSSAVAIVTANCAPNVNRLDEDNLEPAIEFDFEGIAENIEIEQATVDGLPAARATYSLSVEGLQANVCSTWSWPMTTCAG